MGGPRPILVLFGANAGGKAPESRNRDVRITMPSNNPDLDSGHSAA
jgi:hypothetical protein